MADELNLDLEEDKQEDITRKDSRIKSLSEKVKTTAEERDAEKARAEKAEAERQAALKDAEFYKGFSTVSTKYQGASEYQDKIREKTNLGLDVEEATMLVLTKEGKFVPPKVDTGTVAGGSAATGIHDNAEKSAKDMSQAERKALLEEAIAKGEFKFN